MNRNRIIRLFETFYERLNTYIVVLDIFNAPFTRVKIYKNK